MPEYPELGSSMPRIDGLLIALEKPKGGQDDYKCLDEDYIYFTVMPENFKYNRTSNWNIKTIPRSTKSIYVYEGTNPIKFSLDLMFHALTDNLEKEVLNNVRWCEALCVPFARGGSKISGFSYGEPPVVWVIWGNVFQKRCVVDSVDISYNGPWQKSTLKPYSAEVSLSFTEIGNIGVRNSDRVDEEARQAKARGEESKEDQSKIFKSSIAYHTIRKGDNPGRVGVLLDLRDLNRSR